MFYKCFIHSQTTEKVSVGVLLNQLAVKHQLELSYSSDLVAINDSIENYSVNNLDSCLAYIDKKTMLQVSVKDDYLVVVPRKETYLSLSGMVVDAETREPLPYANILIKMLGIGTVTNSSGQFSFMVRNYISGNQIAFSFMGYSNSYFTIENISRENLVIEMVPKAYELQGITVLPQSAQEIVARAVKNIKRNYHRRPVQMDAFYRNTNYSDTTATQLIEAALLIEDKGIARPSATTKIELQEIRKSKNYQVQMDKKHEKALEVMEKYFGGHRNIFYRAYANNLVRKYKDDWWYKPLTDYETFKYEFEGYVWLDSVKVYKIKFIYDKLWNGKRASENKNSEDAGYIYINASDFGILKIEQWWKMLGKSTIGNKPDGYFTKNEVGYQKINGKYYMKYALGHTIPNGAFVILEDPDAPKGEQKIKSWQWAEQVLLVTNINANKKEFDRIKYREQLSKIENSYKTTYDYHPEFWTTYNVLKEKPVEIRLIEELEWEKSLTEQFKENSTSHAEN